MLEKIYEVTFMSYTNALNDTVSDWDGEGVPEIGKTKYLHVGKGPFLVRESELERYRKYGQGYRSIKFVGCISEEI